MPSYTETTSNGRTSETTAVTATSQAREPSTTNSQPPFVQQHDFRTTTSAIAENQSVSGQCQRGLRGARATPGPGQMPRIFSYRWKKNSGQGSSLRQLGRLVCYSRRAVRINLSLFHALTADTRAPRRDDSTESRWTACLEREKTSLYPLL